MDVAKNNLDAAFVGNFLTTLFGRNTKTRQGRARPPRGREQHAFAIYRDKEGGIVGVMAADLSFAAATGSVLSLIPAAVAKEAVKAGAVTGLMEENFEEVANICARFFSVDGKRAVLREVSYGTSAEGEMADVVNRAATGMAFEIEIQGYDRGKIMLFYAD